MSRFKYIFHQEIPDILRIDDLTREDDLTISDKISTATFLESLKSGCKYFKKNPNHHFQPYKGMSTTNKDRYLQICEIKDSWKPDEPSRFHLIREIHKQGNQKFIEFTELYECQFCAIYCKSTNSYHLPAKIFNRFSRLGIKHPNTIKSLLKK